MCDCGICRACRKRESMRRLRKTMPAGSSHRSARLCNPAREVWGNPSNAPAVLRDLVRIKVDVDYCGPDPLPLGSLDPHREYTISWWI